MASTGAELELPLFWGRKKRLHYVMADVKTEENPPEPKRKQNRALEKPAKQDLGANGKEKKTEITTNNNNNIAPPASKTSASLTGHERRASRQDRLPESTKIPKLYTSLTHAEKAQDFASMGQTKFSSRPKRRYPKAVKEILEFITPGNCLTNISMDRYEVKEKPSKKKSSGLKALVLKHRQQSIHSTRKIES